jgi:hypothetical protein
MQDSISTLIRDGGEQRAISHQHRSMTESTFISRSIRDTFRHTHALPLNINSPL